MRTSGFRDEIGGKRFSSKSGNTQDGGKSYQMLWFNPKFTNRSTGRKSRPKTSSQKDTHQNSLSHLVSKARLVLENNMLVVATESKCKQVPRCGMQIILLAGFLLTVHPAPYGLRFEPSKGAV